MPSYCAKKGPIDCAGSQGCIYTNGKSRKYCRKSRARKYSRSTQRRSRANSRARARRQLAK